MSNHITTGNKMVSKRAPLYMRAFNWAWEAGYLAGYNAGRFAVRSRGRLS